MRPAKIAMMVGLIVLAASLAIPEPVLAAGYPWRDHAPPFDFRFGNNFDMHQQSQQLGSGELQGFQYIEFTGALTSEGQPVAEHGQATVGWVMHGIPATATLVAFDPHHPVWLLDPADLPRQPGYVHFHWLGAIAPGDPGKPFQGFLLKHTARDTFFFLPHNVLVTPGIDEQFHPNIVTSWP